MTQRSSSLSPLQVAAGGVGIVLFLLGFPLGNSPVGLVVLIVGFLLVTASFVLAGSIANALRLFLLMLLTFPALLLILGVIFWIERSAE